MGRYFVNRYWDGKAFVPGELVYFHEQIGDSKTTPAKSLV